MGFACASNRAAQGPLPEKLLRGGGATEHRGRSRATERRDRASEPAEQVAAHARMEAFLISLVLIAVGEIGDKTQLLSLLLATRYRQRLPIVLGILVATLAN